MKEPNNLEQVSRLEPDFLGYIFFKGSSRYVGERPDPALFSVPASTIHRVGVFVNEPLKSVRRIIESGRIDMAQLHGSENPEYCKALVNSGIHVIKAMSPDQLLPGNNLEAYNGVVHYFLFDTSGEGHGGTGKKFNWDLLRNYSLPVPFLLSGGIGPDDGASILELDHLGLRGVDVNSRFEDAPGKKNLELLEHFMKEIRK